MGDSRVFREEDDEEEEDEFFDSRDDIPVISDSCPGSPGENFINWVWSGRLISAQERRYTFMKWMGLDLGHGCNRDSVDRDGEFEAAGEVTLDIDKTMPVDGALVRVIGEEIESSIPGSSNEGWCGPSGAVSEGNTEYRFMNFGNGIVSVVDEFKSGVISRSPDKVCFSRTVAISDFERSFGPSSSNRHLVMREDSTSSNSSKMVRRSGLSWLRRLGITACIVDRQGEQSDSAISDSDWCGIAKVQRVRVHPYKKRFKEFSAIYRGQDIKAHEGAILTMKFSPDGRYLASGGEDGVVCVWGVSESARVDEGDVPIDDPSCIYFRMDTNYKLAPVSMNEEKKNKSSSRRTSNSACVIIPPDIFQLFEKPLHIFRGHNGDVLDLSWSKNKYLLSSSTDKTVCLWQVGCNSCLTVFSHNNFVTCIQFNPVDEKYFISGSIDGKVRIWDIPGCQVVDWIDAKEIVTAVCYRPDGKVGVVGFMSGDCHFYDVTGNHLQLDAQISMQSKKKFPYKRITGFQFSPTDHQKLMVTSADSQIRIVYGVNVISKYRGLHNAGSSISASFTSDGRHIISASEDSHVYIWSHSNQDPPTSRRAKSTWSYESFFSSYVSVAIPWHGLDSGNLEASGSSVPSHDFFSELLPKGSATWPEEQLPLSSLSETAICRSDYKFLRASCQNTPHAWGQVVMTAGSDGRIRSFQNYGLPIHL